MKKILPYVFFALILTFASCKKKESDSPGNLIPAALNCSLTQMSEDNGNVTSYYYDAQNRISRTATRIESQADSLFTNYNYTDKTITAISNNGLFDIVQTIYLNSFGFADSAVAALGSFGGYTMNWEYNANKQVIRAIIYGDLAGIEVDQEIISEYTNGNKTKQTLIDNASATTTVSTLEYYLDKPNKAKAFEEKSNYINSNTNLVKKSTVDAGTITNYTYEFDTEGNVSQMKMLTDQNEETWNKYIWSCK